VVKLDVVKAAFSGFGVIGRNPMAILVWTLFVGVVGVLPAMALFVGIFSTVSDLIAADQRGVEPTPEMILPMLGSIFALLPVLMLSGLVMRTVLTGAIYRAVLFPKDSGWFYLRLGARELWLALLFIVVGIIGFAVSMAMMAVVVPVMLIGGSDADPMVKMMLMRLAMLPVYGVMIFLFVRFCLAFPMTFADSSFRLMESWKLTRGNGWRIVLVLLLLLALVIVAEIVLAVIIVAAVAGVIGAGAMNGAWTEERITAFFSQDPSVWIQALLPWIVVGTVFACVLSVLMMVIFTAPWAEAYRQLRGSSDAVA
jgi:hypothetical protein